MQYSPSMIPQFISRIEQAASEQEIKAACQEIKAAVVERHPNENSRRRPMAEIRKAVRDRFPIKPVEGETCASFPYFYTASGKRRDPQKNILNHRLEHLAIKHLSEEWNVKPEVTKSEAVKPEVVKPNIDILSEVNLSSDELATVKLAIGEADVKDWVKQAMLQRANAINALRQRLDEDLSMKSSFELMNEKKYQTNTNATRELVKRAVRAIKDWNYNHPDQKWCITNKLISEVTKSVDHDGKGVTVKAIAKAVEGMDLKSYNADLEPVVNRSLKGQLGEPSELMSIKDVVGIDE